jgi:hypothetical protein
MRVLDSGRVTCAVNNRWELDRRVNGKQPMVVRKSATHQQLHTARSSSLAERELESGEVMGVTDRVHSNQLTAVSE